jgi:hypothetical protein
MRPKVALPVRFVSLEESLQTTTRELALEGAFLRCVEAPELGTRIVLDVQFKMGAANTFAEVDEIAIDPHDPGFFARFVQPGQLFLDRVRETLVRALAGEEAARAATAELSTEAGTTRRASTRFAEKLVVKLGGRGSEAGVFAHNISATGLFVLMPNPPGIGTLLNLELELPDKLPPVPVQAHVVRSLDAGQAAEQRTVSGAGLVFMGGNDEFRERYTAYIAALSRPKK